MYLTPIKGSIYIIGTKIDIIIDDNRLDLEEADGLYTGQTIILRSQYDTIKEYLRVYRHECIHALCDSLGIQLDHNLEEILAHTISHMITYDV